MIGVKKHMSNCEDRVTATAALMWRDRVDRHVGACGILGSEPRLEFLSVGGCNRADTLCHASARVRLEEDGHPVFRLVRGSQKTNNGGGIDTHQITLRSS